MTSKEIIYIVIGVAVVALVIVRQLTTRPVRETSAARFTLILGVIGVIAVYDAWKGHTVGGVTVAWIVATLLVGAGLGVVRALTVRVWRTEDGSAVSKGSAVTAGLWILSLAAHLALEYGIDHSTKVAGLGASTLLLYLAVTLGAQREVILRRASVL